MIEAVIAHLNAHTDMYSLLFGLACCGIASRFAQDPKPPKS